MTNARLSLICAMSRNRTIGIKNDLPWHLPQDLEHFKNLTKGKPIIMGRLTYQSILARRDGKPLPHRPHYVISRQDLGAQPEGVKILTDLDQAIATARIDYADSEIMIIGGASIYEQSLSRVDRMYLTIIDQDVAGDAFFPEWDADMWAESSRETYNDPLPFAFITLDRRKI